MMLHSGKKFPEVKFLTSRKVYILGSSLKSSYAIAFLLIFRYYFFAWRILRSLVVFYHWFRLLFFWGKCKRFGRAFSIAAWVGVRFSGDTPPHCHVVGPWNSLPSTRNQKAALGRSKKPATECCFLVVSPFHSACHPRDGAQAIAPKQWSHAVGDACQCFSAAPPRPTWGWLIWYQVQSPHLNALAFNHPHMPRKLRNGSQFRHALLTPPSFTTVAKDVAISFGGFEIPFRWCLIVIGHVLGAPCLAMPNSSLAWGSLFGDA